MLNLLVWNMRGIGKIAKRRGLKKLLRIYGVYLASILEPKVEADKIQIFASSIGMSNYVVNSLAEKNIWILWDDRMEVTVLFEHAQAITVEVSFLGSTKVFVSFVYAACDVVLRRPLWDHLLQLSIPVNVP